MTTTVQQASRNGSRQHQPDVQGSGWNESAEASVLAALLIKPGAAESILPLLTSDDFYLPVNQRVFSAARELHACGRPIDPITVAEHLSGDDVFKGGGGRGYLHGLIGGAFTTANASEHAGILKRDSRARRSRSLGYELANGEVSLEEAHDELARLITPLSGSESLFLTARDLCQLAASTPNWILPGYLARGAITELAAKIKLGKTHLALDLVAAVLDGRPFLDRPTLRTPVVYLSEERTTTMAHALRRVGLAEAEDLYVSFRHNAAREWPQAAGHALAEALGVGAGLVVVDTLADWAGLDAEKENDAGAALLAMRPLQTIAAADIAVLVLRHERKGGGQVGDSARGSSAFGGAADILLSLQRTPGAGHENRRELTGVGRLDDVPPSLTVDLVDQHYVSRGTGRRVAQDAVRELLLACLPAERDEALTETEIRDLLGEEHKRTTTKEVLDSLVSAGDVHKEKGANPAHPRAHAYWQHGRPS